MIEIRHELRSDTLESQRIYNCIYQSQGIRQLDSFYLGLLDLLAPKPGQRLLDVACGAGVLPKLAARRGVKSYGVDLSFIAIHKAYQEAHLGYAVADGERLPFPDNFADYVTSVGSLEHYLNMEIGAQELVRVLAPRGQALILLPNTFSLIGNLYQVLKTGRPVDDGQPLQRYASRGQWEDLLQRAGLKVIKVAKYNRERPRTLYDLAWYLKHVKALGWLSISPLVPLNLSNCFIFVCRKVTGEQDG